MTDAKDLPPIALPNRSTGVLGFDENAARDPDEKDAQKALRESETRLLAINRNLEAEVSKRVEELHLKEMELEHTRRLEAVGRLAGGVAHDFNNLLTGIVGIVEQTYNYLPEKDPMREDLGLAMKAAESAFSLVRQLLAFSRRETTMAQELNLSARLADIQKMLTRLIGEDVTLHSEFRPGAGHVRIDPGQLEQIIINLAVNARDAMPRGGDLFMETAEYRVTEPENNMAPGVYAQVSMRDTGIGMCPETMDRIFEPFFSTKGAKGTGLGLSTVYGIVRQNGGDIRVRSKLGEGTTFDVFLPQVAADRPGAQEERRKPLGRASETVLVVEDELIVRRVICSKLRSQGYTVIEAADGTTALDLAEKFEKPIHLLLTDIVMPGINGRELAETLTGKRPGLKILFMSGFAGDILDGKGVLDGNNDLIEKDTLSTSLLRKIRGVLERTKTM